MDILQGLASFMCGSGLLIFLFATALIRRRGPANFPNGIRNKASYAYGSDYHWYLINIISMRYLAISGLIIVLAGWDAFMLPLWPVITLAMTFTVLTVIFVTIPSLRLCFVKPDNQVDSNMGGKLTERREEDA